MKLTFAPATIVLAWCYVELVGDAIKTTRTPRSTPPAESRGVGWAAWTTAVVLNLLIAWEAYGLLGWYRQPSDLQAPGGDSIYFFETPLVSFVIVAAFDASLIRKAVRARRVHLDVPRLNQP
ncbi:MAG: hypothetical protein WAK56_05285 [Candidatus Sulfotelmatobacter sp.]